MGECVFDTSFIFLANGQLAGERPGNLLNKRLSAIRRVVDRRARPRYNQKLLTEYQDKIRVYRNDVIELFVAILDTEAAINVKTNRLKRADLDKAQKCGWPLHDQHVLAAAIGGNKVVIHVTENALGACSSKVKRLFGVSVNHIA